MIIVNRKVQTFPCDGLFPLYNSDSEENNWEFIEQRISYPGTYNTLNTVRPL